LGPAATIYLINFRYEASRTIRPVIVTRVAGAVLIVFSVAVFAGLTRGVRQAIVEEMKQ
jgi:hypothetical protein